MDNYPTPPPSWFRLPLEIRLRVFEILAQDPVQGKQGLSRLAGVCKDWQHFFEPKIYQRLTLSHACLDAFDMVVRRQRGLVKHVWLRIELTAYNCPDCNYWGTENDADNAIVADAIKKLFSILSVWRDSPSRLCLELSIYSPSDSQHGFGGDFHLGPEPFEAEPDKQKKLRIHDPRHTWRHGRRSRPPLIANISKLLVPSHPKFPNGLPIVQVVDGLLIRRQTRHTLHSNALGQILTSLPNLECIKIEPWRGFFYFPLYPVDCRMFSL